MSFFGICIKAYLVLLWYVKSWNFSMTDIVLWILKSSCGVWLISFSAQIQDWSCHSEGSGYLMTVEMTGQRHFVISFPLSLLLPPFLFPIYHCHGPKSSPPWGYQWPTSTIQFLLLCLNYKQVTCRESATCSAHLQF